MNTKKQPKRDRVAEFMKVARQRYANNPKKWRRLYDSLHDILPTIEANRLEAEWVELDNQEEFEDWDDMFMQATIEGDDKEQEDDEADGFWGSGLQQHIKLQQSYQQQIAAQQLAAQQSYQQYRGYNHTTMTGTGGASTNAGAGHRGFWTRVMGGKE